MVKATSPPALRNRQSALVLQPSLVSTRMTRPESVRTESIRTRRKTARARRFPSGRVLDRVTGSDSSVTDYVLETPATCPNCRRDILEKTLIEPA